MNGPHPEPIACGGKVPDLTLARKLYAYGEQIDYFDARNCIGWTRLGTWDRPEAMAVVMSNGVEARKKMFVGERHKGEVWTDLLGWTQGEVTIDGKGWGVFSVNALCVAVWVKRGAAGRERFGRL